MTVVFLDYRIMHVPERANLFHLTREKVHETVQLIYVFKEWRILYFLLQMLPQKEVNCISM